MAKRFENKVVVVTGGANGLGRASAMQFARDGGVVAILDVEEDALAKTAADIRGESGTVLPLTVNLTSRNEISASFDRIRSELGPIDILLNNVGQTARERASEFWCSKSEVWDFVIDVSLKAAMACTREVVPQMRERRSGKIVNIASDAAIIGDAPFVDYSAAKAGVMGFTRALARELAPFQINVNAVCPGPINTRAMDRIPAEVKQRAIAAIPLGRLGEPQEIADGVTFLASDQASFITGQMLVINGGRVFY